MAFCMIKYYYTKTYPLIKLIIITQLKIKTQVINIAFILYLISKSNLFKNYQ